MDIWKEPGWVKQSVPCLPLKGLENIYSRGRGDGVKPRGVKSEARSIRREGPGREQVESGLRVRRLLQGQVVQQTRRFADARTRTAYWAVDGPASEGEHPSSQQSAVIEHRVIAKTEDARMSGRNPSSPQASKANSEHGKGRGNKSRCRCRA